MKLKISTLFIIIASTLFSCSNPNKDEKTPKVVAVEKKFEEFHPEEYKVEDNITPRDYSIDTTNSYSRIFFDSSSLVKYLVDNKIDPSVGSRMISFYNARNYQFSWFSKDGPTEQARGFWNMHSYLTTYANGKSLIDSLLQKRMDNYVADDDTATRWTAKDAVLLNTELKMTHHYIMFALLNYDKGFVERKELESFIPAKKENPDSLVNDLLDAENQDKIYYEGVNPSYKKLKEQLKKYVAIQKEGGWPKISVNAKELAATDTSRQIAVLKRHLFITGDMPAEDSTEFFTPDLDSAIRTFQVRHGYKPTGKLTDNQLKDMNVPVEKRISQILINLSRTQWLVSEPEGKLITVNIPEFILHVKDGKTKVFDMVVVVGKQGSKTTMFTGNLNTVVFSPYWNVPYSISKKEIAPGIARSGNAYLARQNMEVVGSWGNGIPRVRQKPGGNNSLGRVKFLFPNSYDIYFHDTPSKGLFKNDKRAYSHGCIRLSEPVKMANYLLQSDTAWNAEKIDSAMHLNKEKYVRIKPAVPVLITYYTAWVDDEGLLHFADDIYGHDKDLTAKMFKK